jgi:hypothetical protein
MKEHIKELQTSNMAAGLRLSLQWLRTQVDGVLLIGRLGIFLDSLKR